MSVKGQIWKNQVFYIDNLEQRNVITALQFTIISFGYCSFFKMSLLCKKNSAICSKIKFSPNIFKNQGKLANDWFLIFWRVYQFEIKNKNTCIDRGMQI